MNWTEGTLMKKNDWKMPLFYFNYLEMLSKWRGIFLDKHHSTVRYCFKASFIFLNVHVHFMCSAQCNLYLVCTVPGHFCPLIQQRTSFSAHNSDTIDWILWHMFLGFFLKQVRRYILYPVSFPGASVSQVSVTYRNEEKIHWYSQPFLFSFLCLSKCLLYMTSICRSGETFQAL